MKTDSDPFDAWKVLDCAGVRPTFLCSYPKAGRTWIRFFVASAVNARLGLSLPPTFARTFKLVPYFGVDPAIGLPARMELDPDLRWLLTCCHRPYSMELYRDAPLVLLLRNPLDSLVSLYYHRTHHQADPEGAIEDFVRSPNWGMPRLLQYLNSWTPRIEHPGILVTSYEAWHRTPRAEGSRVLSFLQLPSDASALGTALLESSFESMQRAEERDGIPGHTYDHSNLDARRVRRGRIHGFARELIPTTVSELNRWVREQLDSRVLEALHTYGCLPDG